MTTKIISVLFLLSLYAYKTEAQIHKLSIGGGGTATHYLGDFNKGNLALNGRLAYDIGDRGAISLGFMYGLPMNERVFFKARANESPLTAYKIKKVDIRNTNLNYHYFIGNDNHDKFGIYIIGGANFTSIQVNQHVETHLSDTTFAASDSLSRLNGSFGLNAGLGMQVRKGLLLFYLESYSGLPVSIFGSNKIENDVPVTINGSLGIRFYFGIDPKIKRERKRGKIHP